MIHDRHAISVGTISKLPYSCKNNAFSADKDFKKKTGMLLQRAGLLQNLPVSIMCVAGKLSLQ
jgi:hypothetical protein